MVILKSLEEIKKIRRSNQLVAKALSSLEEKAKPGTTTLELNKMAEEFAADNNAIPAFKGYKGFPYSICSSVNSEIVHGIPSSRPLQKGDIISIDFGILLDGYYGDSTLTISIGDISKEARSLMRVGQECLYKSIESIHDGIPLNRVCHIIQQHAESNNYNVIRQFVGHGIGRNLHELPQIPNYTDEPGGGIILKEGMVLAIEPMIMAGNYAFEIDANGWTAKTLDNSLAVHWEHTVAITKDGPEILSLREREGKCNSSLTKAQRI